MSKLDPFVGLFDELDDKKLSELSGYKPSTVAKYRAKLEAKKEEDAKTAILCEGCGWKGQASDLDDVATDPRCPECGKNWPATEGGEGNPSDPSSTTPEAGTSSEPPAPPSIEPQLSEEEIEEAKKAFEEQVEEFEKDLAYELKRSDEGLEGLVAQLPPNEVGAARTAYGKFREALEKAHRTFGDPRADSEIAPEVGDPIRTALTDAERTLFAFADMAKAYDDVRTVGAITLNKGLFVMHGNVQIWSSGGSYRGELARTLYQKHPEHCTVTARTTEG